jgi:hypothetical protein
MFEYIKRVSIAISFIAKKIENSQDSLKSILEQTSLELLLIAQNFRVTDFKETDLRKIQTKVLYIIDVVDFARINSFISAMNANVFVDSQIAFLKHINNLLNQKTSIYMPMLHLKELDDVFARRSAKENAQNNFVNYNFSEVENIGSGQNFIYKNIQTNVEDKIEKIKEEEVVQTKILASEKPAEKVIEKAPAKKILEESFIKKEDRVWQEGSLESLEQEIEIRQERILKALVNGGGSIREISSKMKDINEKTIQRDLLDLMREKKVIMLGKKRWSKYYLK